jgi:hypothetical protein
MLSSTVAATVLINITRVHVYRFRTTRRNQENIPRTGSRPENKNKNNNNNNNENEIKYVM